MPSLLWHTVQESLCHKPYPESKGIARHSASPGADGGRERVPLNPLPTPSPGVARPARSDPSRTGSRAVAIFFKDTGSARPAAAGKSELFYFTKTPRSTKIVYKRCVLRMIEQGI